MVFAKAARVVIRHPWWFIAAWLVAGVVSLVLSPSLLRFTNANQSAFLPSSFESVQAQDVLNAKFPESAGASGILVVNRTDGAALTGADQSTVTALAASLTADKIAGVRSVATNPQLLSKNGKVYLIDISFTGPPGARQVDLAVPVVRHDATHFLADTPLQAGLTGNAAIQVDSTAAYSQAEVIISLATIALIVVLLGIIFRSPIICVLPLAIIGLVHQMTAAFVADLADAFGFQVSQIMAPLLVVVLFGVGTDYIVFLLFRYRERVRAGEPWQVALERSLTSTGEIILSAALTVAAAFAALLLASLGSLKTLAPGLVTAVLVMMLAALTLVPAILSLLRDRLFWPAGVGTLRASGRSESIGRAVGRHPGRYVAVFGSLLVALSCGALAYRPTYNTLQELPKSTKSLQAYDTMASAFPPGALGPTQVVVTGSAPLDSAALASLASNLSQSQGVAQVLPTQTSADQSAAVINVLLKDDPYSTAALDFVEHDLRPSVRNQVPGAEVLVGGATASLVDVRTALGQDVRVIFPVALGIIGLILVALLRALAAPLYLLLGVGLAFIATLGITSVLFITLGGLVGLDFAVPIVLYLFVLAIGTDYNIAMAHRLREEMLAGHRPAASATIAVTHTAPSVHAAAAILAGTFSSLMLTGIAQLTELGFGVAIGILVVAFVLATRLVPAVAALPRWHFWWPGERSSATALERAPVPQS